MSLRGFHGVATPLSSISIAMGHYSHDTTPKLLGSQPSFSRQRLHTLELPSRSAANYNNPRNRSFHCTLKTISLDIPLYDMRCVGGSSMNHLSRWPLYPPTKGAATLFSRKWKNAIPPRNWRAGQQRPSLEQTQRATHAVS